MLREVAYLQALGKLKTYKRYNSMTYNLLVPSLNHSALLCVVCKASSYPVSSNIDLWDGSNSAPFIRILTYVHVLHNLYIVNSLTGTIPHELFRKPNLDTLMLPLNLLSGSIPDFGEGSDNVDLENLVLFGNLLSGTIPDSVHAPRLKEFQLSGNMLTGSISSRGVSRLRQVIKYQVSNNQLKGTMPTELSQMANVEWVDTSYNSLSGTIPAELAELSRIKLLNLHHNQLEGSIPIELATATSSGPKIDVTFNNLVADMGEWCSEVTVNSPVTRISADCGGDIEALITNCSCCIQCCDSRSDEPSCVNNTQAVCSWSESIYTDPNGPYYHEGANTNCECDEVVSDGEDETGSLSLSCIENVDQTMKCESCNKDGTSCFITKDFEHTLTPTGETSLYKATFEYTVGSAKDVILEFEWRIRNLDEGQDNRCQVSLNGDDCINCIYMLCVDNRFRGYVVDCSNIAYLDADGNSKNAGTIDICDENPEDTGPLSLFALQDPFLVGDGCPTYQRLGFDLFTNI